MVAAVLLRASLTRTAFSKPLLLACVASLALCAQAEAQTPVSVHVDATAAGAPLEQVWAFYGYDEVNTTTTKEGEELLRTLTAAHTSPVHIRTHFLFNTGDGTPALKWGSTNLYTEDADGNAVYDYGIIDPIMDTMLRAGAFPLFELGFMPQALSIEPEPYEHSSTYALDGGSFYPPRDYDKWAALVTEWAEHVKQRYPGAESSWQWELWNEPDIAYWQGTFEEYATLYDHTEAALHGVFPEASLGGPAVATPVTDFFTRFLDHCATGTNAVTGETGTRLDMVSFHAKGGVSLVDGHVQMNLGNQLRLHRFGFDTVKSSGRFANTPIVISEADPEGCAACPVSTAPFNAYRNSPAYGAYEVAMMKRSLELAAEVGVNLRGVLTWAFTFPGTPYFAGYRALATNGIHLPVLNAFKLLGSLTGRRVSVTSSGALPLDELVDDSVRSVPDVDALAVIDKGRIQILVWHYHDDLVDAEPASIALDVDVPASFGQRALFTHTRVDDTHGNAFTVWESQGSPKEPSASQLAELRAAMEPATIEPEHAIAVSDGRVSLTFDLPRFGISLLTLEPAPESGDEPGPQRDAGCSCRLSSPHRAPLSAWVAIAVGFVATVRRGRKRR